MNRYRLTADARRDLRKIYDWMAGDDPIRAAKFGSDLIGTLKVLAIRPLIGRQRAELRPGVRSFRHGPYLIFYRPFSEGIEVLRVIHGRRDLSRIVIH